MSTSPEVPHTDRRRFLKLVGLAGISSTIAAPTLAFAQSGASSDKKPKAAAASAKTPPASAPPTDTPPEISEEGRTLAEVVRQRYGDHLTSAQIEEIAKELTWRMRAGAALRKFKLGNSDEPDFTFKA
jgi:hypothetical protein